MDEKKAREIMCESNTALVEANRDWFVSEIAAALAEVRAEERERCAKIVEFLVYDNRDAALKIAAAIRANPTDK